MISVGDTVTRIFNGHIVMRLVVTEVTDTRIICKDWEFDKSTGVEIDDYLGWGPDTGVTGSYLSECTVNITDVDASQ